MSRLTDLLGMRDEEEVRAFQREYDASVQEQLQEAWDELQSVPPYVERLHPGIALVVVMLDEIVHTDEHPCCDDLSRPCHLKED